MRRREWPERLAAYVELTRGLPFAWGSHDCVLWACGAVQEITGNDPGTRFRGQYDSALGAARLVREVGGNDLRAAIEVICVAQGYAPIRPLLARRGDAVLCPSGLDSWPEALGICIGRDIATPGKDGLVRLPFSRGLAAWRIV